MIGPGGGGFPPPPRDWTPGLVATFLSIRMSMAALRAPVLLVRLRPAPRPGRSSQAPRAGCRRCARHDVAGHRRGAQLLASSQGIRLVGVGPSAWLRIAVRVRCADGARECSARCDRLDAEPSVAGAIPLSPGHNDALDIPDESPAPCLVPAHGRLPTDRGRRCRHAGGGQVAMQLSYPAGVRGVRCPSLGSGWLLSR
jgi:hypothetical protein